jgi:hypothetical protein
LCWKILKTGVFKERSDPTLAKALKTKSRHAAGFCLAFVAGEMGWDKTKILLKPSQK